MQESSARTLLIEHVPFAHANINQNKLLFPKDELQKATPSMEGKPVVINLSRKAESDHVFNSSMDTVGWTKNPQFDGFTAYCDVEITNPDVIDKFERMTSDGKREINAVSMGAKMSPVCSICNAPMIEGHEHQRGQAYDGEECVAVANDTEFEHLALTNFQADADATLENSKFQVLETSTIKIKEWAIRPKTEGIPMKRETAQEGPAAPPSLEERMAKCEETMSQLAARLEQSEILPGGQADQLPQEKENIGKSVPAIAASDPTQNETPTDEEKEKKKMLEEYSNKYKTSLTKELATKLNVAETELAKKGVAQLEAMLEVANIRERVEKAKQVPAFGSGIGGTETKVPTFEEAFLKLTPGQRIDKYGPARAMEIAHKLSQKKVRE